MYFPAGKGIPITSRVLLVSKVVASLAPVRHTLSKGTSAPKISRSRLEGLLYSTFRSKSLSEIFAVSFGLKRGEKIFSTNTEYISKPSANIDRMIKRRFSIIINLKIDSKNKDNSNP